MTFPKQLLKKHVRLIVMTLILVISVCCFFEIVDDVFKGPGEGSNETLVFDKAVLKTLQEHRSPGLNQSMIDITALGSFSVITLLTIVIVIFLVTYKDWSGLFYLFIIMLGTSFIPQGLKDYYMRARPDALEQLTPVQSHSFPSGHSFGATVAYFSLAYLVSREIKNIKLEILYYLIAAVVVSLVGTSRMYLGVHYPTDIMAGLCVGLAWCMIVAMPFVYVSKRRADNEVV